LPAGLVVAEARRAVPKKMPTPSVAPVNPAPVTVTAVLIVSQAGLKEEMTGAAVFAGDAATTAARTTASAPNLDEKRRATHMTAQQISARITTPTIFWPDTAWQGR